MDIAQLIGSRDDLSLWLTVVGVVLAIAGPAIGYVLYRRGLRERQPCWDIRTRNLIADYASKVDGLSIEYGGSPIKDLSVSMIIFWNRGRETIDHADLDTGEPYHLRIATSNGARLLNVQCMVANNKASEVVVTCDQSGTRADIDFSYLDHSNGAVFRVIHTGTSSADVSVVGSIKRVRELTRRRVPEPDSSERRGQEKTKRTQAGLRQVSQGLLEAKVPATGVLSMFFVLFLAAVVNTQIEIHQSEPLGTVMLVVWGSIVMSAYWYPIIRKAQRKPPWGLEAYYRDI